MMMILHVDDFLVTGDKKEGGRDMFVFLGKPFKVKDLGRPTTFLGVDFVWSKNGAEVGFSVRRNIEALLES